MARQPRLDTEKEMEEKQRESFLNQRVMLKSLLHQRP